MFDIEKSHENVSALLATDASVAEGMNSLLDFCEEISAWQGWDSLRKLDYAADKSNLERWLERVLTEEPPDTSIKAYWFGLFNPVINGQTTCGLYLAGAEDFDENDDTFEWACGPEYFPDGRYAQSNVLEAIYQSVNKGDEDVASYGEYVLCLGYAGLVIRQLAISVASDVWLGETGARAIAVGFDSGDGVLLGSVTTNGWAPRIV